MKGNKFSSISLLISTSIVIALIAINLHIIQVYSSADGKTKALFGMIDVLSYSWIYLFVIPATLALIFAVIAYKRKETKWMISASVVFGIVSFSLVFIRFWWFQK